MIVSDTNPLELVEIYFMPSKARCLKKYFCVPEKGRLADLFIIDLTQLCCSNLTLLPGISNVRERERNAILTVLPISFEALFLFAHLLISGYQRASWDLKCLYVSGQVSYGGGYPTVGPPKTSVPHQCPLPLLIAVLPRHLWLLLSTS